MELYRVRGQSSGKARYCVCVCVCIRYNIISVCVVCMYNIMHIVIFFVFLYAMYQPKVYFWYMLYSLALFLSPLLSLLPPSHHQLFPQPQVHHFSASLLVVPGAHLLHKRRISRIRDTEDLSCQPTNEIDRVINGRISRNRYGLALV